jgi:hypothetical protein
MLVDRIILKANKKFSNSITSWATSNCNDLVQLADKNLDIISIDSLLIFNQNQILTQDVSDLRLQFDKLQKPILHIDINGTLSVGISNLELWIERNKCRSILILGADDLVNNINLERFLQSIN